jgi:hypothetical protein
MHAEKRDRPSCSPRKKSIAHTKKGKKYPSRPLSAWVLLVREVHCQHKATSKDGRMTFKASLMNAASLKDKFYKEVGRKASECSAAAVTKFVAENL